MTHWNVPFKNRRHSFGFSWMSLKIWLILLYTLSSFRGFVYLKLWRPITLSYIFISVIINWKLIVFGEFFDIPCDFSTCPGYCEDTRTLGRLLRYELLINRTCCSMGFSFFKLFLRYLKNVICVYIFHALRFLSFDYCWIQPAKNNYIELSKLISSG